jgi:hypothetical protein
MSGKKVKSPRSFFNAPLFRTYHWAIRQVVLPALVLRFGNIDCRKPTNSRIDSKFRLLAG